MNKLLLSVVATAMLSATTALAADMPVKAPVLAAPPSPWDWAFGGALMSDYNFRGISQSNRAPSVTAYSETRYNFNKDLQAYVGAQYWAVTLPTAPSCECDLYGGIRPTIGPFAFDFGYIYYWYPKETQLFTTNGVLSPQTNGGSSPFTVRDSDYWEVYGKVTYDVVKDMFAIGGNVYYSPNWLRTGGYGLYASGTAKFTGKPFKTGLPMVDELGWYVSGELGHYWLGNFTAFGPGATFDMPDYWTWNVGLAFTWKVMTFDVRYYDTDLSRNECFQLTSDPRGFNSQESRWCGSSVIGKISFDLTAVTNLK